jgi:Ca-activated chloride channel homolog
MSLVTVLRHVEGVLMLLAMAASATAQQKTVVPSPQNLGEQVLPPDQQNSASPTLQTSSPQDSTSGDEQGVFVFRKQVEEVVLHATVVDERLRLATHLDRDAFTVFEDGHPQTITSFHREDVPVAVGILIDNSGSMRDKRQEVNRAVLNLVRAGNPADQVFIVNFSQNPYLDQDFTSDISLLERALGRTSQQGSTALYDAVVASATHLENNQQLEKKLLLVITDGEDNMSRETLQDAIRHLQQRNGPVLYAVGLMGLEGQKQGREALERLANATGGTAFFPQSLEQVGEITESLAYDIRRQYTITYKPQNENTTAQYHPIVVEARAPSYERLTVRTRSGYYTGESVR